MYAPPPRRQSRLLLILVIVVVIIVVVGVFAYVLAPAPPSIQVTEIDFFSPDNVCGLNDQFTDGFVANTTDVVPLAFEVSGNNATKWVGTLPCNITTVSASTAGFTVSDASVPLPILANETVVLSFDVTCPGSSYDGPLDITVT